METDIDTQTVTEALREELASVGDVVAAYLYGSVARGQQHRGSDVDVALLLGEDPPGTLQGLKLDLAAKLGERLGLPVQIVLLNQAPTDLVHRVVRDGTLLVDRDPGRRIRFEVHSRNEYFDLEPIRRLYRHGERRAS